ncbi:MAG TPA: restriction endonuclease, partial [Anaerolineales bacterium]|nr:restriction endonuclease [Anaerolineales bacterium]
INIVIGKGPSARAIRLKLPHFTIIGTTSKPSQVDKRLLRWVIPFDFVSYSLSEIEEIVILIGEQFNLYISRDAARLLAPYCEGNPGHVKALIRRIRSYYNVGSGEVSPETAQEVLIHFGYNPQAENSFDWIKTLQNMSGVEFEDFIGEFFQRKGYSVEFTSTTGDHGIDLILKRNKEIIAVQCKKWSSPVGEAVIRDFLGSMHHAGIKIGVVIATTTFSSQARTFIKNKPVKLIDLDNLIQLIR